MKILTTYIISLAKTKCIKNIVVEYANHCNFCRKNFGIRVYVVLKFLLTSLVVLECNIT